MVYNFTNDLQENFQFSIKLVLTFIRKKKREFYITVIQLI